MSNKEEKPFQREDAVRKGINSALVYGGVGLFAAAVTSAVQRKPVGSLAVFTRFGSTITTFGLVGGIYDFSSTAAANLREKKDPWNSALGGFLGGSIVGMHSRRLPPVLGFGALFGITLAAFDYTGGSLKGWGQDPDEDGYERKERLRRNRRRPIEETIAEIGEGRGIHPPGYEERRRQRLKEKYGVEINPVCADPNQAQSS